MLKENCVKDLRVKILSKSTGQDIEDLRGKNRGTIDVFDTDGYEEVIKVYVGGRRYNFLTRDLEPLGVI